VIRHTYKRARGGAPYASPQRAHARSLAATGAPDDVSAAALAAMVSEDGIETVLDVLFELESNRLARTTVNRLLIDGAVVTPSAGNLADLTNGKRVGSSAVVFPTSLKRQDLATKDAAVRLTWTGRRRVNVVEVHGDPGGQITSARVEVARTPNVWTTVGTQSSPAGRLAVRFAEELCYGVRVHLLAAAGSPTGTVSVVEVDPMFVIDVSADVETVEVAWTREADPGSSADPVGNYEASEVTLTIDDTSGAWNPGTNASLDVGHRIEVAFGVVHGSGAELVEELFPAGVFYSEPFDTDSDSTTVTITGTDRLGRQADAVVSEPVLVGSTVGACVRSLAATYLDLDADQVVIPASIADLVFPYLYPSGNLGSYLADLAKATGATVHIDALDRLVMARRADVSATPVAEITDATSLIGFRRPPGYDVTTSIVTVTASPLTLDALADLWAMPSGGLVINVGQTYRLVALYDAPPAVNGYVTGIVADGAYTITAAAYYADRAELSIRNDEAIELTIADLRIKGNPLVESSLSARAEHTPSVTRYGPRELAVDARLAQTQRQVELIADVLLDAFRSLDDDGVRRLPDLALDALGLLHVEAGDRVTLSYPEKGLGGDYTVLGRRLTFANGAILSNDVRVRESPSDLVYGVADRGLLTDDGVLVGY
jgi:hypothetical protein